MTIYLPPVSLEPSEGSRALPASTGNVDSSHWERQTPKRLTRRNANLAANRRTVTARGLMPSGAKDGRRHRREFGVVPIVDSNEVVLLYHFLPACRCSHHWQASVVVSNRSGISRTTGIRAIGAAYIGLADMSLRAVRLREPRVYERPTLAATKAARLSHFLRGLRCSGNACPASGRHERAAMRNDIDH